MSGFLMPSWDEAQNPQRAELVFESRNKGYGAYILRKLYPERITKSFTIGAVSFVFLISLPVIIQLITSGSEKDLEATQEVVVNLTEPPPIDENEPPPPPPPPPPPVQETIKFTPPVVVDKPVEEDPPPQEKLSETVISTVTQEGDPNAEQLPPPEPIVDPDEGKIFTIVEEMPSFPGGEAAMMKFVHSNIKYPAMARENGIEGVVYVSFVVDKEGKVRDPKVIRGKGAGLDEEALRVVRMFPNFSIGKQNGRSVSVQFNFPFNFKLQ